MAYTILQGRYRWNLSPLHIQESDTATQSPFNGSAYFDVAVVRTVLGRSSWSWSQGLSAWRSSHAAAAGPATNSLDITAAELDIFVQGAISAPYFDLVSSQSLLPALSSSVAQLTSDDTAPPVRRAQADLLRLVLRFVLPLVYHHVEVCIGAVAAQVCPLPDADKTASAARALAAEGAPLPAAQQIVQGIQFLSDLLHAISAAMDAEWEEDDCLLQALLDCAEQCTLALGLVASLDRPQKSKGKKKGSATSARGQQTSSGAGGAAAANSGDAPPAGTSPDAQEAAGSPAHKGVYPDIIARLACSAMGDGVVDMLQAVSRRIRAQPAADLQSALQAQFQSDAVWSQWSAEGQGNAPQANELGMHQAHAAQTIKAPLAGLLCLHRMLSVAASRAAGTVLLSTPMPSAELAASGWMASAVFSGGVAGTASKKVVELLHGPVGGAGMLTQADSLTAGVAASAQTTLTNAGVHKVIEANHAGLSKALQAFHSAKCSSSELLKHGFLDESLDTSGLELPPPAIALAHWLDAHLRRGSQAILKNKSKSAHAAGVPLANAFGTVYTDAECASMAVFLHHAGSVESAKLVMKQWYSQFVRITQQGSSSKDRLLLVEIADCTDTPSDAFVAVHKRFCEVRDAIRELKNAETAGELASALKHIPRSSQPELSNAKSSARGDPAESKEEEGNAGASESKAARPASEPAAPTGGAAATAAATRAVIEQKTIALNDSAPSGLIAGPLSAHVRQLDAPTSMDMALAQLVMRADMLLCLAPAARSPHGQVHNGAPDGWRPAVSTAHLADDVGQKSPGTASASAIDDALHAASAYLTHGQAAPPRAVLAWLLSRSLRAELKKTGLQMFAAAVRAALGCTADSMGALQYSKASFAANGLLLASAREVLLPLPFVLSARSNSKLPTGSQFAQDVAGVSSLAASQLHAAWANTALQSCQLLQAAKDHGDAATFAIAAKVWLRDLQAPDFELLEKFGGLDALVSSAASGQQGTVPVWCSVNAGATKAEVALESGHAEAPASDHGVGAQHADLLESVPAAAAASGSDEQEQKWELMDPSVVAAALQSQSMNPNTVARLIRLFAETPEGRSLGLNKLNRLVVTAMGRMPQPPQPTLPEEAEPSANEEAIAQHARAVAAHARDQEAALARLGGDLGSLGIAAEHSMVTWWIANNAFDGVGAILAANNSADALIAAYGSFAEQVRSMGSGDAPVSAEDEMAAAIAASLAMEHPSADTSSSTDAAPSGVVETVPVPAAGADAPTASSASPQEAAVDDLPASEPLRVFWTVPQVARAALGVILAAAMGCRRHASASAFMQLHLAAGDVPPAAPLAAAQLVRSTSRASPLVLAENSSTNAAHGPAPMGTLSAGAIAGRGLPAHCAAALALHSDAACRAVASHLFSGEGVAAVSTKAFMADVLSARRKVLSWVTSTCTSAAKTLHRLATSASGGASDVCTAQERAVQAVQVLFALRDMPVVRTWMASQPGLICAWQLARAGGLQLQQTGFLWLRWVIRDVPPHLVDAALWSVLSVGCTVQSPLETEEYIPGTLVSVFLLAVAGMNTKLLETSEPIEFAAGSSLLKQSTLAGTFTVPPAEFGPLQSASVLLAAGEGGAACGGVYTAVGAFASHSLQVLSAAATHLVRLLCSSTRVYDDSSDSVPPPPSSGALPRQPSLGLKHSSSIGGAPTAFKDIAPIGSWAHCTLSSVRGSLGCDVVQPLVEKLQHSAHTGSATSSSVASLGLALGALFVLNGSSEVVSVGARVASPGMQAQAATAGATSTKALAERYSAFVVKYSSGNGVAEVMFPPTSGQWHPGNPVQRMVAPVLRALEADPLPSAACVNVLLGGEDCGCDGEPSLTSTAWFDDSVLETFRSLLLLAAMAKVRTPPPVDEEAILKARAAAGGGAAGGAQAMKGLASGAGAQSKNASGHAIPGVTTTLRHEQAVVTGSAAPGVPESTVAAAAASASGQSAGSDDSGVSALSVLGVPGADETSFTVSPVVASSVLASMQMAAARSLQVAIADDIKGLPLIMALFALALKVQQGTAQSDIRSLPLVRLLVALGVSAQPLSSMIAPRHVREAGVVVMGKLLEHVALGARAGSLLPLTEADSGAAEDSPEVVARKAKAQELSNMGFDYDLVLKGLEIKADDPERVLDWILSGEAEAFKAGDGLKSGPADGEENPRYAAAQTLALTAAKPTKLCVRALELKADNPNAALNWLLDEGTAYLPGLSVGDGQEFGGAGGMAAVMKQHLHGELADSAVLDDIGVTAGAAENLIPDEEGFTEGLHRGEQDSDDSGSIGSTDDSEMSFLGDSPRLAYAQRRGSDGGHAFAGDDDTTSEDTGTDTDGDSGVGEDAEFEDAWLEWMNDAPHEYEQRQLVLNLLSLSFMHQGLSHPLGNLAGRLAAAFLANHNGIADYDLEPLSELATGTSSLVGAGAGAYPEDSVQQLIGVVSETMQGQPSHQDAFAACVDSALMCVTLRAIYAGVGEDDPIAPPETTAARAFMQETVSGSIPNQVPASTTQEPTTYRVPLPTRGVPGHLAQRYRGLSAPGEPVEAEMTTEDQSLGETSKSALATDAAVIGDAATAVMHAARQPLSSEHEAVFLPLPSRASHGISAVDWKGCVVSFPYVKRQRLNMVAGASDADYDDGTNTLKRQWRLTVLTGILLDDCSTVQDEMLRVAVLHEATGLLHVRLIHRQRLFVHASVMGSLPLSTVAEGACAPLVAQAISMQHACMRNSARGALLNLLLLSTSLFSQGPSASSPLLGDAPAAPSLGPGPLRGIISRAELMRLVKLSAATEDTFGVHAQGEAAVAAGASVGAEPGQYLSVGRGGSQVLPIGSPSVGAWLLLLQTWLDTEGDTPQLGESDQLTTSLTAEAARHISLATNPGSAADSGTSFLMRESLHPHYHSCETHDTLTFPGARALWVFFDSRSETHSNARLNFFAGLPSKSSSGSVHSVGGAPKNFRPFVIHGDTVHLSFTASHSSSEACWGYRMYVAPMLGLAWTNEAEVATGAASLEWACYALEFLLGSFDSGDSSSGKSAVHSAGVFNSLVSYLRARGTPFKSRVVSLLTQLLKTPEAYPTADLPNMALLHGVEKAVFKYVENELSTSAGRAFPAGLLQLIELLITARMAQRTMSAAQSSSALESGVMISNIGVQTAAPPGLAAVFLPQSLRVSMAEAAAAASTSAGAAAGAGGPGLQLSAAARHAIRDMSNFTPETESASVLETELGSRALSDILLETMDIIEAIHSRQEALAARSGTAGSPGPEVLPLPPALLLRCVLAAGWASDKLAVTPDILLSAAVSLGSWTSAADDQLVQWLTTITSPTRRSLVADAKARLDRDTEGASSEFDWDPCNSGSARSPLVLQAAKLRLLLAPEEGQAMLGDSGKPVHASIPDDAIAFPALSESGVSMPALRLRVALLQLLNRRLKRVLPLIDVVRASSGGDEGGAGKASAGKSASAGANLSFSLGHKLRTLSHCVFIDVKRQVLDGCIEATWTGENGSGFSVNLDNKAAFKHMEAAAQDTSLRCPDKAQCVAAQLYKALTKEAAGRSGAKGGEPDGAAIGKALAQGLRSKNDHKESLWKVAYKGEDGMDWGGLYRDCFSRVVDDLFSDRMDIFVPTPNNLTAAGQFQDKWLPNPSNTTPSALAFYTFVGRLVGVTLRHTMQLPFDLAPAVWARVLNAGEAGKAASKKSKRRSKLEAAGGLWELHDDVLSQRLRDLEAMTYAQFVAAHAADVVSTGASSELVAEEDVQPLYFTSVGSEDAQVELCPGGDDRRVLSKSDLQEYIALTKQQREHEFDAQCAAIRGGLVSIIPPRALQLLTWREIELLVCGDPVVDVDLLKKHTQYDSYEADSEGVARFWRCFEILSNEERGKFIRFSWGRSRLPEPGQFSRKFRLSKRGGNDGSLPVAHACFWQVEWPEYSTDEIALQRMRIAINYGMSGEFLIA